MRKTEREAAAAADKKNISRLFLPVQFAAAAVYQGEQ
jgi:hypothetical protein